VATIPWNKIGVDLFELDGSNYLAIIDYYSNYPEVIALKNTQSIDIIESLKNIFTIHGIPNCVFTDNGPQFTSNIFK